MKAFRVSGKFWMGQKETPFTVETIGNDDAAARDRVLSTIGSKHRVDRHHITIEKVEEISVDQITDSVVEKKYNMVK